MGVGERACGWKRELRGVGVGQAGTVWNVLGHRHLLNAECDSCFCFENYDPPGTFVPPHLHPAQDEFIFVREGIFDRRLAEATAQARPGDLQRMPRGVPHAYCSNQPVAARAFFRVTPAGRLRQRSISCTISRRSFVVHVPAG